MSQPLYHTILGSTGNIGKALAMELAKNALPLRLVSRNPSKVNPSDEVFTANLLDAEATDRAVAGSDTAYLVVGITYKTNIWEKQWPVIMRNVLDACIAHGTKLVFFDNMYAYDPAHVGKLTESSPINPSSRKGIVRAKIAQEMLDEIRSGRLKGMIVRAADFYGKDARFCMLNESVINRMKAGKSAQWLYQTNKKHSFTYIPDAANATAFLAQHDAAYNQVWHLPTDRRYPSAEDIAAILSGYLSMEATIRRMPPLLMTLLLPFIPILSEIKELSYQLENNYCFDSSKIEKAYGLKPTPIEEGLKACL
ncbi:NAD-dependent epimerase/dehydratase [Lunatimonas lonarensis]|uniref:NAD-dependent epimerase/dehydratase n=1 Tax=Lunatimonas lonarensis TaxID=1232681 RepID=R7ZV82_9BACT|nr:NAD-dependent epimerase/dehydratase family protein [Lunatimonas lonarensis]EON77992.1 NAD-dependent epimerase/dehydratase [Lunatimonas lonarensis]